MLLLQLIWFTYSLGFLFQDQPHFKGGQKYLFSFINTNMIYPEYSKQNCLQGTVNVSFKLTNKGRIFNSEIQKGYGTDLDNEALRIVRLSSGRWIIPAGYDTTSAVILPINFNLKNYGCELRSKEDIQKAVSAYHSRLDLTKAIFNFYEKKAAGAITTQNETEIIALKSQLGYTQKYIEQLYRLALRKLKQGDKESACEDLKNIKRLGNKIADESIAKSCE
ncbi:MAG: TonB family protein [Flavobacterium sp.]|nr:TonB family protein [Pedobacter sp.]